MSQQTARPPAVDQPAWARAHQAYVAKMFKAENAKEMLAAQKDYGDLSASTREFYQAYLAHLTLDAMETLHGDLTRIDNRLRKIKADTRDGADALDHIDKAFTEVLEEAREQARKLDGPSGDDDTEQRPHPVAGDAPPPRNPPGPNRVIDAEAA